MDDEMPLKREELRKRAEEKAAKLAAEGMELRPVTVSGRTPVSYTHLDVYKRQDFIILHHSPS